MTGNQRRPGFRLPWSAETDEEAEPDASGQEAPAVEADASAPAASAPAASAPSAVGEASSALAEEARPGGPTAAAEQASAPEEAAGRPEPSTNGSAHSHSGSAQPAPTVPAASAAHPETESSTEFMRDLVAAMRAVADDARTASVEELRTKTDEQVRRLEEDAQRRQEQLRARSEADVAGIGEWAKAEAERIKAEAEQRVVARKALLDQQLAADATRNEAETKALRDRVSEYERELEAYHAQLAEINDPAAFAAAAKRMPRPPQLARSSAEPKVEPTVEPTVEASASPTSAPGSAESNGSATAGPQVHPAEEEVLASRLAELAAEIPAHAPAVEARESSEPMTTEIVVKGLGSFGAITGFRQALASVEGVAGVALSLGQTGEFVFRATHAPGFDVRAAIVSLEGEGATIEDRAEGGLRVTLDRAR